MLVFFIAHFFVVNIIKLLKITAIPFDLRFLSALQNFTVL